MTPWVGPGRRVCIYRTQGTEPWRAASAGRYFLCTQRPLHFAFHHRPRVQRVCLASVPLPAPTPWCVSAVAITGSPQLVWRRRGGRPARPCGYGRPRVVVAAAPPPPIKATMVAEGVRVGRRDIWMAIASTSSAAARSAARRARERDGVWARAAARREGAATGTGVGGRPRRRGGCADRDGAARGGGAGVGRARHHRPPTANLRVHRVAAK